MSLLFNACFTLLTESETLLVSAVQARGGLCYKIPQSCCFVLFFSICLSLSLPLTFKILCETLRRLEKLLLLSYTLPGSDVPIIPLIVKHPFRASHPGYHCFPGDEK